MEIRHYVDSDFDQVRQVLEKSNLYWNQPDNKNSLKRKIADNPDSILVAIEEGKIIGTTIIVYDFMPFIFRVAVDPEYRKKGVAKQLMETAEEQLKKRGYDHVNILVAAGDEKLQHLYERRGYEKGNSYVWMFKNLK